MAPVKFDDISKTAKDLLADDFQTSGYQFKSKQKTNFDGAVVTSTVDIGGKDAVQTPAKLSFKFPKPFGCSAVAIDKLEVDKSGKFKFEASGSHKVQPDLKIEAKSDLAKLENVTTAFTFTGIADTMLKFETKLTNPAAFNFECARKVGAHSVAVKLGADNLTAPDIGVRFYTGSVFNSLLVQNKFSVFTSHTHYKVSNECELAADYIYGGKKNGDTSMGLSYKVSNDTKVKAKFVQASGDAVLHAAVKHAVSKGFTVVGGAKYEVASGNVGYGFQVSIE